LKLPYGQFPTKIPGAVGQTKLNTKKKKNIWRRSGFNKKNAFDQLNKLTREFGSMRSRNANIAN
jgi:hypothetical protein